MIKTYIFRCEFVVNIVLADFVNVEHFRIEAQSNRDAWNLMNEYRMKQFEACRKIEIIGIVEGVK